MVWTRRHVVGTAAAVAFLAGCLSEDDAGDDSDDSSDDVPSDAEAVLEGADLEDYTGEDQVDVTVDPDTEGFDPEAFEIDVDTLVNWQWEGTSTEIYPIDIPEECVWDEEVDEETVDERSAEEESDRLFWADGAYLYASRDDDGEVFTGAFRVLEADDGDE